MKIGDKVIIKNPINEADRGKVYTVRTNPLDIDDDGIFYVTLEGRTGLWTCSGLEVVEESHEDC